MGQKNKTAEEISETYRLKWVNDPNYKLLSLLIDAMEEYASQQTEPLTKSNNFMKGKLLELHTQTEHLKDSLAHYKACCTDLTAERDELKKQNAEYIEALRAMYDRGSYPIWLALKVKPLIDKLP